MFNLGWSSGAWPILHYPMYWQVLGCGHEDCQFRCSPTGGAHQGLCHRQCGCCGLLQHQTTSSSSLQCQWLFQGNKVGIIQNSPIAIRFLKYSSSVLKDLSVLFATFKRFLLVSGCCLPQLWGTLWGPRHYLNCCQTEITLRWIWRLWLMQPRIHGVFM